MDHKGVLWFEDRLVVPKNQELRMHILNEVHLSNFPFIRVAPKCTKTFGKISGGPK